MSVTILKGTVIGQLETTKDLDVRIIEQDDDGGVVLQLDQYGPAFWGRDITEALSWLKELIESEYWRLVRKKDEDLSLFMAARRSLLLSSLSPSTS